MLIHYWLSSFCRVLLVGVSLWFISLRCFVPQPKMLCKTCSNWSTWGNFANIDKWNVPIVPDDIFYLRRHGLRQDEYHQVYPEIFPTEFKFLQITTFKGILNFLATKCTLRAMLGMCVQDISFYDTLAILQHWQVLSHPTISAPNFGDNRLTQKFFKPEPSLRTIRNLSVLPDSSETEGIIKFLSHRGDFVHSPDKQKHRNLM